MILKKFGQFFLILIISIGWIFSGWPQISLTDFPPKADVAEAVTLTYVGGTSGSGTGATYAVDLTSLSGGSDSAPEEGDLVIVVTGWASTANGDPGVDTSGYTELTDQIGADDRDANVSTNWKLMTSTPDTSVTVRGFNDAANGGATAVHVWRGADQSTPIDVTTTVVTGANASLLNSPSITAVTAGAVILTVGLGTEDASPVAATAPTNYTNTISGTGAGSTMSAVASIASRYWLSGPQDPGVWTGGGSSTSDSWAAATIAIRPASFTPHLTYVGGTSGSGTGATYAVDLTSLSGGSDSAPEEGDLVIVVTGWASTADGDPGVDTAGYTELADQIGADDRDANVSTNWKLMTSTPDTSVTVRGFNDAANGGATAVHVWRGADQTTPIDVTTTVAVGANSSLLDSPSITPVTFGAVVLTAGLGTGDTTPVALVDPVGYVNPVSIEGAGTTMGAVASISSFIWEDTAIDPPRWAVGETSNSDSWGAVSIAIRPAPAFNQAVYKWFSNNNSTDVGAEMAEENIAVTLATSSLAFRLRMLIHVSSAQLDASGQDFKLQFATRSGTCDTAFSGESYSDVTSGTAVAYSTANTPADGDNLTSNVDDPAHSGHTIVNQDYEEANNFTNSVAAIPSGQDGKWDFSLIDNSAPAGTTYCFRVIKSSGILLDTYTVIPQITIYTDVVDPTLTFSISDNSIGFGTLSASAARYATGDLAGSASEVEAHTITASTNGTDGYAVTVNGTSLVYSVSTIDAIGSSNTASSAGTEQFGLRMTATGGNGAVSAPYAASGFAFDTAAFPDVVASDADGDDVTTTYSARYLGNISAETPAGVYGSSITYTITATF